ncbi:family 10 glycosylhydrolase [bacterium]|nr:family 10 glycosylhydrolase [bacterium]
MQLSQAHHDAVNRRRRIVVQYDAHGQLGADFGEWLDFRFRYFDQPGSQVDSIFWDVGFGSWAPYPSQVLERFEHPGLRLWWDQGIDWIAGLVTQTHQRGLEAFWNHRVSEVDLSPTESLDPGCTLMLDRRNPLKEAHPDWVLKTWWWQGMWNYAVPQVREFQVAILREVAETYDLEGFQLDFARHVPCLPVGRQWELRDQVTEFLRMVRSMLEEVAASRGRPYLLAARIPQTLAGCHADGFDIAQWVHEDLVDILTLGSRSMTVDLADFAEVVAGHNLKLQPCFDDHHATDGYRFPPVEFLRGVFANWWAQGADSVATFNWTNAPAQECEELIAKGWQRAMFNEPGPASHGQAYCEVGSPDTIARKDKVFAVERRGGYPWAEGFFNRNDEALLPLPLRNDGTAAQVPLYLGDPLRSDADQVAGLKLRLVLFGAREGDRIAASLNGMELPVEVCDHGWKDPQIFSPAPQPASGGRGQYAVDPRQQLLRLDFLLPASLCRRGWNRVDVWIADRIAYVVRDIALEKVELHVQYR